MIKNFFKRLYTTSVPTEAGKSHPIGATVYADGVNFCLYSKNATGVELLLFDHASSNTPKVVIELDKERNQTSYYWHVFVPGIKSGQIYGYRVHGPYHPREGNRFDAAKLLLDPYAKGVVCANYNRPTATRPGDNCGQAMKGVVIDDKTYDWEGDEPLGIPLSESIIYEMHVGGFTKHPNSGLPEKLRGTYLGIIEKIPYLKALNITAVELLPVHQFDTRDVPDKTLVNYWGYSTIGFFAPHGNYGTTSDPVRTMREFRDMVKALHKADIEVILDVVYNHTAEGNHEGPTLSMRGIDNKVYYILDEDKQHYKNYSGTGNTVKANHSVVRRMIIDSLRFWVVEMHVDGFRFDLASILSRDENGKPMENAPILWEIESDPVLSKVKIIAEAWDLEQYQLGSFIGDRWAEWNGKYRDDVRAFLIGHESMMNPFVQRITGSPDLFRDMTRDPNRSINFVTCHDGFTLNDLVSYNEKHNWANGEDNRDGHNHNISWNHGTEGETDDKAIETLRLRQMKNFFAVLLLSQGTPMINMGDEVQRTQQGNNNAYCQDNEISWFDWDLVAKNKDLLRFVRLLNKFNRQTEFFQEKSFWNIPDDNISTSFELHGTILNNVNWSKDAHALSFTLYNPKYKKAMHVMINSYWKALAFELPELTTAKWRLVINTKNPAPRDIYVDRKGPLLRAKKYRVTARSVVVLQADE
ncbi:MAG: glycogen debranching protein GlgX [Bacteroidota bacterium]